MERRFARAATHFKICKATLMARWCERVRADPDLPEQRLKFSDEQLQDHLPSLLNSITEALEGRPADDRTIRERGAVHGHTRRLSGYSIQQLIWEFSIFRKLLRETLEEIADGESIDNLFLARELILENTDRSELGSIQQYVEEGNLERDAARNDLKEANLQKDRFMAVLSHELRNPLAAITSAIHILKGATFSDAQRQRALEIIERQTSFQTRLVDDLLDVNRISQGKLQLKRTQIDLREPIRNSIDTYLVAIESKAIKFQFASLDREIVAYADSVRIEQIVSNLLNNAIKFTRAGGAIEISLSETAGMANIVVSDTGTGMEAAEVEWLFELFSQADGEANDAGLGIGLWLAKRLTEMHGGSIRAISEGPGTGSRLIVQLPCLPADRESRGNARKRVLIVEDDPDQRELLRLALSNIDAELLAARDGTEAIRLMSRTPLDVCILDLSLPDISGYDLLRRLLEIHAERRPITIALTGYGRPEDEARIKAAGFDHHIVKPADIDLIRRIIRHCGEAEELSS